MAELVPAGHLDNTNDCCSAYSLMKTTASSLTLAVSFVAASLPSPAPLLPTIIAAADVTPLVAASIALAGWQSIEPGGMQTMVAQPVAYLYFAWKDHEVWMLNSLVVVLVQWLSLELQSYSVAPDCQQLDVALLDNSRSLLLD